MAKNKENQNEEIEFNLGDDEEEETTTVDQDEEETEDQNADDSADDVQFQLIEGEAPKVRNVKIRVNKPINTSIGDVWYHLVPNKEYPVPPHVREILRNAGYLAAL